MIDIEQLNRYQKESYCISKENGDRTEQPWLQQKS
jgi:hypothetical protein